MKRTVVNVNVAKAEINRLVKEGFIIYLTGRSGSGKDYVANAMMSKPDSWCFMDRYGKQQDQKWVVNIPDDVVKKSKVFVGLADNVENVMEQILTVSGGKLAVVYVMPSPEIFREANAAKAKDARDTPAAWVEGWLAKSKASDGSTRKELISKMELVLSKITESFKKMFPDANVSKDLVFLELKNDKKSGPITNGWHKSPGRVTQEDGEAHKKGFAYFNHPKRLDESAKDLAMNTIDAANARVVIGVDGTTEKEALLFIDIIKRQAIPSVLSVDIVEGEYKGKLFDNSKDPNMLAIRRIQPGFKSGLCLIKRDAAWAKDLLNS